MHDDLGNEHKTAYNIGTGKLGYCYIPNV